MRVVTLILLSIAVSARRFVPLIVTLAMYATVSAQVAGTLPESEDSVVIQFQQMLQGRPGAEQDIAVKALDDNRYELSLTSGTVLENETAQVLLLPTAEELCEGLIPNFGRYRFSSAEPIAGAGENVEEPPSSFSFVQELECWAVSPPAADRAIPPAIGSDAEAEEVKNTIRAVSIQYFTDIANERYEKAYAVVDDALRAYSTAESWEAEKRSFQSTVGAVVSLKISRLTIYDNPPGAPEPGLYVAADFDNEYENAPIHCGYLMWFLRDGGEFRVTREESGHVTSEQLRTIPIEQVPALRQRLRCVAP